MFNSEFYKMCDELHASLVDYYGNEFDYLMANMDMRVKELKESIAESLRFGFEQFINAVEKIVND